MVFKYSLSASLPRSFPKPDSLKPPNGVATSVLLYLRSKYGVDMVQIWCGWGKYGANMGQIWCKYGADGRARKRFSAQ